MARGKMACRPQGQRSGTRRRRGRTSERQRAMACRTGGKIKIRGTQIECEQGKTIDVLDATYGRHDDASVCPHSATSDQDCHAAESRSIVREECQGQQSCAIAASNTIFGDPCGGTFKYLTVRYKCSTSARPSADDGELIS